MIQIFYRSGFGLFNLQIKEENGLPSFYYLLTSLVPIADPLTKKKVFQESCLWISWSHDLYLEDKIMIERFFTYNHKKNFLFLIAWVFITTGCSSPRKNGQILRLAIPADVQSIDIAQSHDVNSEQVIFLLFEGLMRKDEEGIPQPAIAKKVEVSEDKKTYVFHLRKSKWSDGVPVNAYDFEYSWKRSLNPKSKFMTRFPHYFDEIKNAKPAILGQSSVDEVGIKAQDALTLIVELEHPIPYFLELTTLPFFFPIPSHLAEKDEDWGLRFPLISNGPFTLCDWKKNHAICLEKNLNYWDESHVFLDAIHFSIIPDSFTMLILYEKNQLDWVGSPFVRISYDLSSTTLNLTYDDVLIYWFSVNTEKFPLNNKKFRKALSLALHRDEIVKNVFHLFGFPRTSVLSPPLAAMIQSPSLSETLSRSESQIQAINLFDKVLEELSLTRETFPEITINYATNVETHDRIAQSIQDEWRKTLGIKKITLKKQEWATHYKELCSRNHSIGFLSWTVSVLDPIFIFEIFRDKKSINNMSSWENEEYTKLLDQAKNTLDAKERKELLIQLETILMEELPVIPLCSLKKRFTKNPKLKGEILSPFQLVDFKSAYFENTKHLDRDL